MFPVEMKVLGTELFASRDLNPATACCMEAYNPTVGSTDALMVESSTAEGSPGTVGKVKV